MNDAVRDLEKSQELNDHRQLYRSRFLLDQDRAVRGANLANIYRDEGMTDVSVREALKAVNSDYANYSSHLFLADSFYDLRDPNGINLRYETPYVSEYLIANLLSPVGAGTLSQQVSQQEYSKLFERDGVGASFDGRYFSHGDYTLRGVEYGVEGNSAFSLEQHYQKQHGYRTNSDQQQREFDFRWKQQITPGDSVYAQAIMANSGGGNLIQYYDPANATNSTFRYHDRQDPILLAGYHHEWAPGLDTLVLGSRLTDAYTVTNPTQSALLNFRDVPGGSVLGIIPFQSSLGYHSRLEIYSMELQQIWQTHQWTTVVGARFQEGAFKTSNHQDSSDLNIFGLLPTYPDPLVDADTEAHYERENVYGYEQWQPVDSLRVIGGVSYDRLVIPLDFRYSPVSPDTERHEHVLPKAGIIWNALADTTLRAAFAESVGGASFDQSFQLEPTQVAGFNQAFRSLIPEAIGGANAGATFTIYGVSLEQKLPSRTYLALEGDYLQSRVHRQDGSYEYNGSGGPFITTYGEELDFSEASVQFSAHQLIGENLSLGAIYKVSRARLTDNLFEFPDDVAATAGFVPRSTQMGTLQSLNLVAVCQLPSGFFARAEGNWNRQDNAGYSTDEPGNNFWQCNVMTGWRFYRRHAEVTLGILNLMDKNYRLNPLNLYQETPRDRTFYTELKIQF